MQKAHSGAEGVLSMNEWDEVRDEMYEEEEPMEEEYQDSRDSIESWGAEDVPTIEGVSGIEIVYQSVDNPVHADILDSFRYAVNGYLGIGLVQPVKVRPSSYSSKFHEIAVLETYMDMYLGSLHKAIERDDKEQITVIKAYLTDTSNRLLELGWSASETA